MKILYGIQGTGNGHITRARALTKYFEEFDLDVDFLLSGRERKCYFDMQEFGDSWKSYRGLTFSCQSGSINIPKTIANNNLWQLYQDIRDLDLKPYDLVLTDFEPISAHAARIQDVPCIGIGHQYAFLHNVPTAGASLVANGIMRQFAPATHYLGLHWHHFGAPILPPIAHVYPSAEITDDKKIVVYLGFEEPQDVIDLLEPFDDYLFVVYGPYTSYQSLGHIQLKPLSRSGFCRDVATCHGVIGNAGFGLASEAVQLGKKLLVKPLQGQMEQLSNAKALVELGLGLAMSRLDRQVVRTWLDSFHGKTVVYPDVAKATVRWLSTGNWHDSGSLVDELWAATRVIENNVPSPLVYAPAA